MRHRVFGKKLGRNHNQRQALFRNLTKSMFTYGSIETTDAKAKAVISTVERLSAWIMNKPELDAKRELFKVLQDQKWVNSAVANFKSVYLGQDSNFTKVTKIKRRQGDDALIVKLSFTKKVDLLPVAPKKEEKPVAKKITAPKKKAAAKVKTVKEQK